MIYVKKVNKAEVLMYRDDFKIGEVVNFVELINNLGEYNRVWKGEWVKGKTTYKEYPNDEFHAFFKELNVFEKALFTIDGGKAYEGYTKGDLWNGWECPFFTKETAFEFIDEICNEDTKTYYDETKDAFYIFFSEEEFNEANQENLDDYAFFGEDIEVDGEIIRTYPIGAWCWVWDKVEEGELNGDGN